MGARSLTGRRELLDAARAELTARPGVLFHGPLGIGKSVLVGALTASLAAHAPSVPAVLHCSPAAEDARLPFVGLVDLFARVPESCLETLAPEPRAALRAALLRGPEPADGRGRLAVRVAVLDVLRKLAATGPVVLVVDGLQWLDTPTAEVLVFAVRRLGGLDIRVVAAERVAEGEQPERLHCCPPGTVELPVPPLPDEEVAPLLRACLGADLPPRVLRAVQDTAAGNPLYALELGRAALRERAPVGYGPTLAVPRRLRDLLLSRARTLPEKARHTLLVTSAAAHPDLGLLRAAGLSDPAADLADAERLGIATTDIDETVRFRHPLVRAAVYADASENSRRHAHALLARVTTEPVERARHLAHARPHKDEDTARTLMSAAEYARRAGALGAACELAGLAAGRTPGDRPADRADRLLAAAEYACDAGQPEAAGEAAETVLAEAGSARRRVRARLVLLRNAGQALEGAHTLIEDGLRDADGDAQAEAWLHHWAAVRGVLCGELAEAARHAGRAARRAAVAGDPETRIGALATLARVRSLAGEPLAADVALEEALALAGGAEGGPQSWRLIRMRAILALDSDRVTEAREQVVQLLAVIEEFAGVEEVMATLVSLTRIQVRAGHCHEALHTAARCSRVMARTAPALYAAALAAAAGGTAEEARQLAEQAACAAEADGDRLFLLRSLAVLGQAGLLAGDPQGAAFAVDALQRVRELGAAMCAADPPLLHWYGDLAEALVFLGETEEGGAVVREARAHVSGDTPGSVLAALDRAEGLREAALGRAKEGATRLRAAVDRLRELPLPMELVRTLIALGAVERRARRRSAARAVLGEALETAARFGAAPLAARARDELARLDAVDRSGGEAGAGGPELTPTEARIARLVGSGATNREVAAELFISVKTVEGALSRVYRKVGVRSRTALAHAMAVAVVASGAAVVDPDGAGQVDSVSSTVTVSRMRPASDPQRSRHTPLT
ncbi:helix-turn-helix transcriptional regulator [Streptomyces monashensis]|uniref:helix-turn-helix transcriptional regulator n=1 Tax=Streptomyces monashensis TaxID=1678012 RepID=UPI001FEBEE49|nr:LuxR family transcriptional regulator [Streptomyces monashensis]